MCKQCNKKLSRWLSGKNLPMQEVQEMWVQSLSPEDPLEKELTVRSSILAWRIPSKTRGAWQAAVHRIPKELDMA